jgi:hypothetical protein
MLGCLLEALSAVCTLVEQSAVTAKLTDGNENSGTRLDKRLRFVLSWNYWKIATTTNAYRPLETMMIVQMNIGVMSISEGSGPFPSIPEFFRKTRMNLKYATYASGYAVQECFEYESVALSQQQISLTKLPCLNANGLSLQ